MNDLVRKRLGETARRGALVHAQVEQLSSKRVDLVLQIVDDLELIHRE